MEFERTHNFKMTELETEIKSLKSRIEGYEDERSKSNDPVEKKLLLETINKARDTLNRLMDQQSAGNISSSNL